MKKIFFFALASLALASCSQDEEFAPEKSTNGSSRANSGALSFSTYTAAGTRATDVTSADVKTNGFKVAAWYDNALYFEAGETAKLNIIDSADPGYDGIADTQTDTYYWPSFSAGNIGFRAFNLTSGAAWTDAKEYESIDFTVAATAADQKDLVIAYAEATEKPAEGVQPLNFTHALSKVNFSFKGTTATNTYTINKVEVIAAGGAATMAFAETTELGASGVDTDQPGSREQKDKVNWTYTLIDGDNALVKSTGAAQGDLYTYKSSTTTDDDVVVSGTTAKDLNENFMLLPQKGKIAVRVYYKIEDATKLIGNCGYYKTDAKGRHDDGTDNSKFETELPADAAASIFGCKTLIVDLADVFTTGWEAGKSYRFTLTLPDDNFMGDGAASTGNTPDGVADMGVDDDDVDLDGDNDKEASEFDQLTPIRFSVTVSDWKDITSEDLVIK